MPASNKSVKPANGAGLKKRKIQDITKGDKNEPINVNEVTIPDYTDEEDSESDDDSDSSEDSDDTGDNSDSEEEEEEEENKPDLDSEEESESKSISQTTDSKPDTKEEQEKKPDQPIDPKYAEFYKRFQSAARNIALSAYNVDDERDEFGNLRAVKALALDAVEDAEADKEVREVMQRMEAAAVPQGLVPLPVPDLTPFEQDNEKYGVMDESGTPDLAQLRRKMNQPTSDGMGGSLPPWLAHPIHIASTVTIPFDHIEDLQPNIRDGVKKGLGYNDAFAVQATLLPPLLAKTLDISPDPRPDILVNAATGSGKTLAYTIPIVQDLSRRVVPQLRAVVLLPTRPLITQVVHVFRTLAASASTKLHITSLHGDHTLRSEQERLSTTTPDIVVSTPGRLVDHLRLGTINLKHLQYLVVDEADRLLSDSFNEWATIVTREIDEANSQTANEVDDDKDIQEPSSSGFSKLGSGSLLKNLRFNKWSRPTQKLIFSATLTRDPGKLALLRIRNPQVYIIGGEASSTESQSKDSSKTAKTISGTPASTNGKEFTVPRTLTEILVPIKTVSVKPLRLMQLIASHQGHTKGIADDTMKSHVLVFVNSNEAAARLARLLTLLDEEVFHLGLAYQRCSSEQPTHVRRRVLRAFAATGSTKHNSNNNNESHEGPINVLVCTDIVARGIDISAVKNVINYDLPRGPREYIHRVGRTARANQLGTAWSFAAERKDHGRFWHGISAHILREGKDNNQSAKDKDGDATMTNDNQGDVENSNNLPVQKYDIEATVPAEDTRDYERIEQGYSRALQRLEKEVHGN